MPLRRLVAAFPTLVLLAACGQTPVDPTGSPDASFPASARSGPPGQVLEIPVPAGSSVPFDVNDAGVVVGTTFDSEGQRGFRWSPRGGLEVLGGPAGGRGSAVAVNARGMAVGTVGDASGSWGVLWGSDGSISVLPAPPAPYDLAFPQAITDHGLVGGLLIDLQSEDIDEYAIPFRWSARRGYELGEYPFGSELRWGSMNARGDIVGSADPLDGEQFGIWLDPLRMPLVLVGSLSHVWTFANDVNDKQEIVGYDWFRTADNLVESPILWSAKSGFELLPGFGGPGQATRINDKTEVVGFGSQSGVPGQLAFFWSRRGGLVNLLEEAGLASATAINNHGQVAGIRAGDQAPVLWTGAPQGRKPSLALTSGGAGATVLAPLPCPDLGHIGDPGAARTCAFTRDVEWARSALSR